MGGKLTFPGGGFYHGTKHAVEALSDVLRFEVRGFEIDVIVIEPGLIRTRFGEAAVSAMPARAEAADPYDEFDDAVARLTTEGYETGPAARLARGPEDVAAVIEKALRAKRPKTTLHRSAPSAKLFLTQRAILPDRAWDAFCRRQFPSPGAPKSD